MLKPMAAPPADLAKPKSEVQKHNGALDKITGDTADLRVHTSQDGKKKYLRVWESPLRGAAPATDGPVWYEIVEPTTDPSKTK